MEIESIKKLLNERQMTFEDLANKMGKERSVVYKTISNGNPTLKFLLSLSNALNLKIDDIVKSDNGAASLPAIADNLDKIDGFVEVNKATYRIRSREDLNNLCDRLKALENGK